MFIHPHTKNHSTQFNITYVTATGLARMEGSPAIVPEALTSGAGAVSAPKPEAVEAAVGQVCVWVF